MLTPKQNYLLHVFQSALVVGAAVYAFITHKIDSTVLAAVIGPYLGAYAGGGVAVKLLGKTSVPTAPSVPAPVATVAPSPAPPVPVASVLTSPVPPTVNRDPAAWPPPPTASSTDPQPGTGVAN